MASPGAEPGAAEHEKVQVAIVVVVSLHEVEAAEEPLQSAAFGLVFKGFPGGADEQSKLTAWLPGGAQHVKVAIVVEIVDDHSSRAVETVEAEPGSHVLEPRYFELRAKGRFRDEIGQRDLGRIAVNGHVGDVQQPAGGHVDIAVRRQQLHHACEVLDGLPGACRVRMDPASLDRQDAALRGKAGAAVQGLAAAHVSDAQPEDRFSRVVTADPGAYPGQEADGRLQQLDPFFLVAGPELGDAREAVELPAVFQGRAVGQLLELLAVIPGEAVSVISIFSARDLCVFTEQANHPLVP